MPDNFESFIQQHRNEFDVPGPSPRVWEALEKELGERRRGRVVQMMSRNWFKAAVIAVLLVNAGVLFYLAKNKHHQQELAVLVPEMQEAKTYYTARIDEKLEQINAYPAEELGLDSTARQELQLRNSTYKMLEKELKNNPGNERIKAALVRYYQLKLELLDKILTELHEKQSTPSQLKKQYEAEI